VSIPAEAADWWTGVPRVDRLTRPFPVIHRSIPHPTSTKESTCDPRNTTSPSLIYTHTHTLSLSLSLSLSAVLRSLYHSTTPTAIRRRGSVVGCAHRRAGAVSIVGKLRHPLLETRRLFVPSIPSRLDSTRPVLTTLHRTAHHRHLHHTTVSTTTLPPSWPTALESHAASRSRRNNPPSCPRTGPPT